ncbi:MAG TPA: cytochrome c [Rhizomicrobium sp.]|jgi:mono/diheme cytochrome c family protein|nr:cytochrome c [Rhizomicrobium sp.]
MTRAAVMLLLFALAACGESMDHQNRLKTYGLAQGTSAWPGKGEALPLVKGTVAQGATARERETAKPPPVSVALLHRGQERYDIYCSVCHGLTGAADGIVVARGFPKPKPFSDPQLMQAPAKELIAAIGQGYGVMYSFSDRVEPKDRWAIVAYIRALQLAGNRRGMRP